MQISYMLISLRSASETDKWALPTGKTMLRTLREMRSRRRQPVRRGRRETAFEARFWASNANSIEGTHRVGPGVGKVFFNKPLSSKKAAKTELRRLLMMLLIISEYCGFPELTARPLPAKDRALQSADRSQDLQRQARPHQVYDTGSLHQRAQ